VTTADPTPDGPIVEFQQVTYTHYAKTVPALSDVNLTIQRGSFTLLVGPSGSGKSTLCQMLNGIIPHVLGGTMTGKIIVNGKDVSQSQVQNLASSIGLLFQDPEWMFATLQVEDEVAFGPENLRVPPAEIKDYVDEALNYVGLMPLRKNLVWALSGGQVQKLGLAAVLAMQTPLIVLDEPTANLDPATTHAVHELILRLRQEGKTIILVTKDLDEFMAEADDVILLSEGRVLAQGSLRDMVEKHGTLMLDLGVWLPEPTEIGLRLKKEGLLKDKPVPLTVEEAAETLAGTSFKDVASKKSRVTLGDVLVRAENVRFSYTKRIQALLGFSFEIRQGEIAAIVGQNGAGKSTLSKLLVGLLKPSGGQLTLFGRKARQWHVQDLANDVALVFQNPEHQFLSDTVREELEYSLLAQGIDDQREVDRRVRAMLERLEITESAESHPFSLSAGSKRRLGVATMLVGGRARLLIVDEPTYGQDKRLTERLMELINYLRREGITVLMITHDMRLVDAYVERAIVMANGEKLFDGTPGELFQQPKIVERAALRPTALRRLVDALRTRGVNVPEGLNTVDLFIEAMETP
jgi:energy-coupling factor transporter ATP-binding protein EcfA2